MFMADVHVPVLEYGRKTGLFELIGEDHVFHTVEEAVNCIEAGQEQKTYPKPLLQSNQ